MCIASAGLDAGFGAGLTVILPALSRNFGIRNKLQFFFHLLPSTHRMTVRKGPERMGEENSEQQIGRENRKEPRSQAAGAVMVEVETPTRSVIGWMIDLSPTGFCVASVPGNTLEVGAKALLHSPRRAEGTKMSLAGVVRHSNGWRHGFEYAGEFYEPDGPGPLAPTLSREPRPGPGKSPQEHRSQERSRVPVKIYAQVRVSEAILHGWAIDFSQDGIGIGSFGTSELEIGGKAAVYVAGNEGGRVKLRYGHVQHSDGFRHGIKFAGDAYEIRGSEGNFTIPTE